MNEFIEKELSKCKFAQPIIESDTKIIIPKTTQIPVNALLENHYYILELANYITNPPSGFTLADNWNKGISPTDTHIKAEISKIMGKMIKVNAIGYDLENEKDKDTKWELWLPSKGITVIREI